MTLSEFEGHVDECADVETISPIAVWEAMTGIMKSLPQP